MDASVRTPLLHGQAGHADEGLPTPAAYGQVQDHNALCWIRGGVVAYLTAVGAMILDYKLREKSPYSNWRVVFDFSIVTYSLLLIYHLVVLEYWLLRLSSLPYDMSSLRKQFYFTMFYTVTTVFTFMNTCLYWFVQLPHDDNGNAEPPQPQPSGGSHASSMYEQSLGFEMTRLEDINKGKPHGPFTEIFGEGWFKAFVIINLFLVSTVIALFEIFWLNSIKRPLAVGAHTLGVIFFAGLYLGWAAIGKIETGADAFYWLDQKVIGSREAVVAASIGFVILAPILYALMYGLIGMRESISRAAHSRRVAAAAEAAGH
ncbi:hypothetical protein K4K59_010818 [Colletotrichum sp. SAR11_240]|nr:hypothetical protein K4K59_010818 [Colletotrichum sp. SAR11_240]